MKTKPLIIRPKDLTRLLDIAAQTLPNDIAIWAYGSRVNGDCHAGSDLDLVLRSPDLTPVNSNDFNLFCMSLTDSNIPILIDVKDWATLPESFQQEILRAYTMIV